MRLFWWLKKEKEKNQAAAQLVSFTSIDYRFHVNMINLQRLIIRFVILLISYHNIVLELKIETSYSQRDTYGISVSTGSYEKL